VATRRAQVKLLLATMTRAWARAVVVIVCSAVLLGAVGLSEVSGYATITGIYMALSPPAGPRARRVLTVVVATLVIAVMSMIGAELTRWTAAIAISLALAGFVGGLLPRLGSLAAAMQMPLLMSFAYSVGQPLSDASALDRGLAVLVALPIFVVAAALAFQVDQRRPLVLGSAQALGALAAALPHAAAGTRAQAETALARFRAAMTRLRDSALPLGGSRDDHAGLALVGAVQEAIVAAELLDDVPGGPRRGEWLTTLARSAGATAAMLAGRAPAPAAAAAAADAASPAASPADASPRPAAFPSADAASPAATAVSDATASAAALPADAARPAASSVAEVAAQARCEGDHPVFLLADALTTAAVASAVLKGVPGAALPASALGRLPSPARRLLAALDLRDPTFRRAVRLGVAVGLAGLVASLLDLGRAYWPVFSVIVILSGPAARDWRRALERLGGTIAGLFLALGLIKLAGTSDALALGLGLAILLPGLVLVPIRYGAAMIFITAAVGLLYAAGGTVDDFLSYRLEDTFVGAAIAAGIGLLLWHTRQSDWFLAAGRMAGALGDAVAADDPTARRDLLVTKAMALRTETLEAAALHAGSPAFGAAWLYTAAAEELIQTLTGPSAEPLEGRESLAARLRELEAECADLELAPTPARPASSAAEEEVDEMATSLSRLRALV
jgi:hypothetical protein